MTRSGFGNVTSGRRAEIGMALKEEGLAQPATFFLAMCLCLFLLTARIAIELRNPCEPQSWACLLGCESVSVHCARSQPQVGGASVTKCWV